jgi:hypothetical protein
MRTHPMHTMMAEFDSEQDAIDALHDLEALPLQGHLHCTVHHRDDHADLVRAENHLLQRVGLSMLLGAPLGGLGGLGVMSMWAAVDSTVSRGLVLGVGLIAGSLFGLLLGGITGIAWGSHEIEEAGRWECMHLADHEVVIALLDDDVVDTEVPDLRDATPIAVPEEIRRIFADHHGRAALLGTA